MKVRVSFSHTSDTIVTLSTESCLNVLCGKLKNNAFVCVGDWILNTSLITDVQLLDSEE